jgi:hypothetical protein
LVLGAGGTNRCNRMTNQRYAAYRSLIRDLDEWRATNALEPQTDADLRDAAEGLLLARRGEDAEESLTRASTTVLGLLALDELDEPNASWLLDSLLACGPRMPATELSDAA